jgi:hypothetical protein
MAQSQTGTVVDNGALAAIGAAIVGFGIVAFMFRIQRELEVREAGGRNWFPWADRLLSGIVTVALLLVLLPIALGGSASSVWGGRLPAAACSASIVALAGYIPALLAHYQFSPRLDQLGSRLAHGLPRFVARSDVGTLAERAIVVVSVILGVVAAVVSVVVTR